MFGIVGGIANQNFIDDQISFFAKVSSAEGIVFSFRSVGPYQGYRCKKVLGYLKFEAVVIAIENIFFAETDKIVMFFFLFDAKGVSEVFTGIRLTKAD